MAEPIRQSDNGGAGRALVIVIALAVFAATFLLFVRAGANDFVNYDDPDYVTANEPVQGGLTVAGVRWALTTGHAANWHPLTWVSHMLDVSLFGMNPRGHHTSSVLWHALAATLAFLALRRLTGALGASALAALWFAVHPLRVESVAWVAERKDVLSGACFFACLWAYAAYAERRRQDQPAAVPYVLALLACALGLMAKPMLVTLPCVLLLLDYWPLGRFSWGAARGASNQAERSRTSVAALGFEKLPFFALAAASSLITYLVQKAGGAVAVALPFDVRVANALVSIVRYVGMIFWPANLAVLYPHPGHWPAWAVIGSVVVILATTIFVWRQRNARPWLIVGWLLFVGMLVPVLGIVQVGLQSAADRYTYLPCLGLAFMLFWTLAEIAGALQRRAGSPPPAAPAARIRPARHSLAPRWLAPAALLSLVPLGMLTVVQVGYWRDSLTLFNHAIAVTGPGNYLAYNNRGVFFFHAGDMAAAVADYRRSLAINPEYPEANNNFGEALAREGRNREAIPYYRKALQLKPSLIEAHNNLANALSEIGELPEAVEHYEFALRFRPHDPNILNNYGASLAMAGRLDEAIARIEEALRYAPDYASAHANVGNILAMRGRRDEALAHYQRALALEPRDARTFYNQGNVLSQLDRLADAAASYRRAIELQPVNPDAHAGLGLTLARLGQRDQGLRELQLALQQQPDHAQARAWLQAVEQAR